MSLAAHYHLDVVSAYLRDGVLEWIPERPFLLNVNAAWLFGMYTTHGLPAGVVVAALAQHIFKDPEEADRAVDEFARLYPSLVI